MKCPGFGVPQKWSWWEKKTTLPTSNWVKNSTMGTNLLTAWGANSATLFAHLKLPHLSFANDEIGDTVRWYQFVPTKKSLVFHSVSETYCPGFLPAFTLDAVNPRPGGGGKASFGAWIMSWFGWGNPMVAGGMCDLNSSSSSKSKSIINVNAICYPNDAKQHWHPKGHKSGQVFVQVEGCIEMEAQRKRLSLCFQFYAAFYVNFVEQKKAHHVVWQPFAQRCTNSLPSVAKANLEVKDSREC